MQFPTLFKTVSGGALAALLFCVSPARAETLTDLNVAEPDPSEAVAELPDTIDPEVWATPGIGTSTIASSDLVTRLSPRADFATPEWRRAERWNGTTQITVKKPLPLDWDTRVGADLNTAPTVTLDDRAFRPLPLVRDRDTGAAYVNVAVPNLAAVEVRVNSEPDRSQFGAAIMRSLPLGEKYAVTFENRYAVAEPLGGAIVPSGIAPTNKVWSTDRLVKFDLLASGTTFAVGTTTSTADNTTHSKLIAEQKIYGPFNVTTSLTDVGSTTAAKSITAGFKLNW